jgi:hypothetical protein
MTRLKLNDLERELPVDAIIRVFPGSVCFALSFVRGGDIEVEFGFEDCKQIIAILERALRAGADSIGRSEQTRDLLKYRFRNLDGGEDTAFVLSRIGDLLEMAIERSDEVALVVRISFEDARRLIDVLSDALKFGSTLPPN